MNRLLTPNGGMPLQLDDLRFLQDAYREGFKGLLHEFAKAQNGNIILSGCEVTDNGATRSLSEGFIMLDFEVLYVPPVAGIVLAANTIVLGLDVSYDPAGLDIFFDNASRDTYEVRRAKVETGAPPVLSVAVSNLNRLSYIMPQVMKDSLVLPDSVGIKYTFVAADFGTDVSPNASYPPYAIKKNGLVVLGGLVDVAPAFLAGANQSVVTLPIEFRKPTANQFADVFLCAYDDIVFRMGLSSSQIRYITKIGTGSGTGAGLSLAGIVYDIDN